MVLRRWLTDRPLWVGIIAIVAFGSLPTAGADPGGIERFAGGPTTGEPALESQLNLPRGVAVAPDDSTYISDEGNYRVVRVASDGTLAHVAGIGDPASSGDGGPASGAAIHTPHDLEFDESGALFIAEEGASNGRVRRIDPSTGVITTVAGGGRSLEATRQAFTQQLQMPATLASISVSGITVAGTHLYIADHYQHVVYEVDLAAQDPQISVVAGRYSTGGFAGDGGPATSALLDEPLDVEVGPTGTLYIADGENRRIRAVDAVGNISTFAGSGTCCTTSNGVPALTARFDLLSGLDWHAGNLYLSDLAGRIYRIDAGEMIWRVAGFGVSQGEGVPAMSARIRIPASLALDLDGNILVPTDNRIRRIDASTATIATIVGSTTFGDGGRALNATIYSPTGLATWNGSVWISQSSGNRVRRVFPDGTITTVAGGGTATAADGLPANSVSLRSDGIDADSLGNLFIATPNAPRIWRVDASTGLLSTVAGTGTTGFSGDGGPATAADLDGPTDVDVAPDGRVLIADATNRRVRMVDNDGTIRTVAGNGIYGTGGDLGPAVAASLRLVYGVAWDGVGGFYIADIGARSVRHVDAAGTITTVAGRGVIATGFLGPELSRPVENIPARSASLGEITDVIVAPDGSLIIPDASRSVVWKVDTLGFLHVVAGNGFVGGSGDGGPATAARLTRPNAVALDSAGALYIAEDYVHRIRRVQP